MKKYKFVLYSHFDAVIVSHPKIGNPPLTCISGGVISTSRVNHPRVLKRGN